MDEALKPIGPSFKCDRRKSNRRKFLRVTDKERRHIQHLDIEAEMSKRFGGKGKRPLRWAYW